MSTVLAVTGTDTGVGKTILTAALAAMATAAGLRVAVVKPVQTGVEPGEPGDLDVVRRLSGVDDLHEFARLSEPLAPGSAARRAGVGLPGVADVAEAVAGLGGRDLTLVEGAGGLLVELDNQGGSLADLAGVVGARMIVVARAGLGTLNAAALTCEAIRARGLECAGVVIGSWPASPGLAELCNVEDLPLYTGAPLRGRLPEGMARLDRPSFLRQARAGLDAELLTPQRSLRLG